MSSLKIKKGDTVKVIAGKDKDKEGKVIAVNQKDGKVVVEGVNMLTKHTKPSASNQNGGSSIRKAHRHFQCDVPHNGKATRIGFKVEDGKKVRYAKSTGEVIADKQGK